MWLGVPCSSFSLARHPALRSAEFPLGLPNLNEEDRAKVSSSNRLLSAACNLANLAIQRHLPGGLENPAFSRLWLCPSVERLLRLGPCVDVFLDYCQYQTPWRKRTRVRFWNCVDPLRAQKLCSGRGVCSATQKPQAQLSGRNQSGQLMARIAEPYPKPHLQDPRQGVFRQPIFTGVEPEVESC